MDNIPTMQRSTRNFHSKDQPGQLYIEFDMIVVEIPENGIMGHSWTKQGLIRPCNKIPTVQIKSEISKKTNQVSCYWLWHYHFGNPRKLHHGISIKMPFIWQLVNNSPWQLLPSFWMPVSGSVAVLCSLFHLRLSASLVCQSDLVSYTNSPRISPEQTCHDCNKDGNECSVVLWWKINICVLILSNYFYRAHHKVKRALLVTGYKVLKHAIREFGQLPDTIILCAQFKLL